MSLLLQAQSLSLHPRHPPLSQTQKSLLTPPHLLRFRTSHKQNLLYLKTHLGILTPLPPESVEWVLSVVNFLKSKGFSDQDFISLSPSLFPSLDIDRTLVPLFHFLHSDLSASPEQARGLLLRCPALLTASAAYRLTPTLRFLQEEIGIVDLRSPTNLNAHLLNTPVEKLRSKVEFLEDLGLSREEANGVCRRFPAVFGYSVENNLRPKVEYLAYEMGRSVAEEVKRFPGFFGFSLEGRIAPRHRHLAGRNVGRRVSLKWMLVLSDHKFYAKWK